MAEEKVKLTLMEKLKVEKTNVKCWIKEHKKSLIKGGVIAGALTAAGGAVAAIVNRCGLPSDGCSCESYEVYEVDFCPENDSEEVEICEESEEVEKD